MKFGNCVTFAAVAVLFSLSALSAEEPSATPKQENAQLESVVKSLSTGVLLLTDEIRELQRDNQQLHAELQELKTQLATLQPAQSVADVSQTTVARTAKDSGSPNDPFAYFKQDLKNLRTQRLSLFSSIVAVEVAAIEQAEGMKHFKAALADNLKIDDERVRTIRAERLHESYKYATEAHEQLTDRVKALNAELTVVTKKVEHLEKRIEEAKTLSN